jgi:ubiquitin-protein ligase
MDDAAKRRAAIIRSRKELVFFERDRIPGITAQPIGDTDDDMLHWTGSMIGPRGSPYEGGTFNFEILLWRPGLNPTDTTRYYPFSPPFFRFTTKLFHPNISSEAYHPIFRPEGGEVVATIWDNDWSPSLTIPNALLSIQAFLTDPDPNEPFNLEAREMLLSNPDKYNRTVQKWVQLYATPFADLRPLHLVLNAAASCPIFDVRSLRAHHLQPPAPLAPTLSPRSLERVLLQELLFRDNKQRVQLMCCSASLSTVACRLSGVSDRSKACQHWQVIGSIMRRCFSIFAARARTREPFHQPYGS